MIIILIMIIIPVSVALFLSVRWKGWHSKFLTEGLLLACPESGISGAEAKEISAILDSHYLESEIVDVEELQQYISNFKDRSNG